MEEQRRDQRSGKKDADLTGCSAPRAISYTERCATRLDSLPILLREGLREASQLTVGSSYRGPSGIVADSSALHQL